MKRSHVAVLCSLLLTLLTACASVGIAPPQNLSERLAYAYGTNAAVRTATARALDAQQLWPEDGEYVLKITDQTRALLDATRQTLEGGDVRTAEGRLIVALNVLDQLQVYLNSKVKKP